MSWFWTLLFISITFSNYITEAKVEKKIPAAVIVGAVYCDTCAQKNVLKTDHFIAGASVAVQCKNSSTAKSSFRHEVKTNKHGEFEVHLPYATSKYLRKIKGCTVELISSNEPYCAIAARSTSSSLRLNSKEGRKYVFTAGILTFKPQVQPQLCEPTIKALTNDETLPEFPNPREQTFLPPFENSQPDVIRNPNEQTFLPPFGSSPHKPRPNMGVNLPLLPELPKLPPLPQLPHLPPLPGISIIPLPKIIPGLPFQPLVPKFPGIPFLPPQHLPPLPPLPFKPTPDSNTGNYGSSSSQSDTKSP